MIGFYVHHHGSGHTRRATTLARALAARGEQVWGLSSLPPPPGWPGGWSELARDDVPRPLHASAEAPELTASGRFHWVPLRHPGLRHRQAEIARWIDQAQPTALVVDQSVEVTVTARLLGVPVVAFSAPGHRTDPPHLLGFDSATRLLGAWPDRYSPDLLPGLGTPLIDRWTGIGAVSRWPVGPSRGSTRRDTRGRPRVALLCGDGGDGFSAQLLTSIQDQTPGWEWEVLSRRLGSWRADAEPVISSCDVVIAAPGQNALAEIAALRRPAVLVPQERPFGEQEVTATVVSRDFPALRVTRDALAEAPWPELLDHARSLDADSWEAWCDGSSADRFCQLLDEVSTASPAPGAPT